MDVTANSLQSVLVLLASSVLDRRVFDSAETHASNRSVKGAVSVGDAIPWFALGGAGLLALDGSNPVRQRTAFAAGEELASADLDFWAHGGRLGFSCCPGKECALAARRRKATGVKITDTPTKIRTARVNGRK